MSWTTLRVLLGLLWADGGPSSRARRPTRGATPLSRTGRIAYVPGDVALGPTSAGARSSTSSTGSVAGSTSGAAPASWSASTSTRRRSAGLPKGNRQKVALVAALASAAPCSCSTSRPRAWTPHGPGLPRHPPRAAGRGPKRSAVEPHPLRGREPQRSCDHHPRAGRAVQIGCALRDAPPLAHHDRRPSRHRTASPASWPRPSGSRTCSSKAAGCGARSTRAACPAPWRSSAGTDSSRSEPAPSLEDLFLRLYREEQEPARSRRGAAMRPYAGLGTMVRLALRRDRVLIPLWAVILSAVVAGPWPPLIDLYPDLAGRLAAAMAADAAPAARFMCTAPSTTRRASAPWPPGRWARWGAVFIAFLAMTVAPPLRAPRRPDGSSSSQPGCREAGHPDGRCHRGHRRRPRDLAADRRRATPPSACRPRALLAFGASWAAVGIFFTALTALVAQLTQSARACAGTVAAVIGARPTRCAEWATSPGRRGSSAHLALPHRLARRCGRMQVTGGGCCSSRSP